MIIQNSVKCFNCGDEPFSAHRHDFRYCKCGNIAVDGGLSYLRRVGNVLNESVKDTSMSINNEHVTDLIESVKWANETGRNEFGVALAVIRSLVKNGYIKPEQIQEKEKRYEI
jgi:hypothetical protein